MTACVLGGTYFIGRRIVHALIQRGHGVLGLNRGTAAPVAGVRSIVADRNDAALMRDALSGLPAIDALVDVSALDPFEVDTVIAGLRTPPPRIVYISSGAVYMESREPCREDSAVGGARIWGEYGARKFACEQRWREYADRHGVPLVILRPPYLYGVGNPLDRESWFVSRILAAAPVYIPRSGDIRIQFLHVDDLADVVVAALEASASPDGIYNTAAPDDLTFGMLAEIPARVLMRTPAVSIIDLEQQGLAARDIFPFRDYDYILDSGSMHRELLGGRPLRYPDTRAGWGEVCHAIAAYHPALRRTAAEEELDKRM